MPIFSNLKAVKAIQNIKKGVSQNLSKSQIVNLLINLPDAKKKLTNSEFSEIYSLFQVYNSNKEKTAMDMYEYLKVAGEIISAFNIIAPYEEYSGMSEYETRNLLEEIRNSEALIKANGLVYGIRGSIGDVFYKLDGSDAAVFSILSISSALKNYLDKKSTNNPIFEKISKSFVCEITKTCANNNEAINKMIENISTLSQSFEDRVVIAKNNFEECSEIELYGIAAASLYCNFQKNTIDIEDESKLEMYFEMFKTVFVKLVESL